MAKRVYSDDDKATVLVTLEANNGNVKKTSRETEVAEQTIRDWKKSAERGALPATVQAALPAVRSAFVDKAVTVRELMMDQLEAAVLNNELKGRDLIVGIGVMTDKIHVVQARTAPPKEEVVESATAQEIGKKLYEYLERSFAAGEKRDADIVLSDEDISDADWEQAPQGELPVAASS